MNRNANNGTCMYCFELNCSDKPEFGWYMNDCQQCACCVNTDAAVVFSSNGVRDANTSCSTECMPQYVKGENFISCTACNQHMTCYEDKFMSLVTERRTLYAMFLLPIWNVHSCAMCGWGHFAHRRLFCGA